MIAIVLSFVGMGLPALPKPLPASAEPNPAVCAPNTSYGVLENGQLRKINTGAAPGAANHGNVDLATSFPLTDDYLGYDPAYARKVQVNGLGVAPDGQGFYAFRGWSIGSYDQNGAWNNGIRNNFELFRYDANGNNPQRIQLTEDGQNKFSFFRLTQRTQNMDLIAGAVNPADGRYYFGGYHQAQNSAGGYNLYFNLRSIDPKDGRLRHVAQIPVESKNNRYSLNDANGDIVFDEAGNFHLLFAKAPSNGSSQVKLVSLSTDALPTENSGGLQQVQANSIASRMIKSGDGVANSLATDSDGSLIVATTTSVFTYDPTSFAFDRVATGINGTSGMINTDLASCNYPPTLEVRKNVVDRAAESDQFKLTADDQSESGVFATAETRGSNKGVQDDQIGPAIVRSGEEYLIREQMTSGSASTLDKYTTSVECRAHYRNGDSVQLSLAEKSAHEYGVTIPETTERGAPNVVCTYTNDPKDASFKVKKESGSAGAEAAGGQWSSEYLVTVE
ncbi:MAG: hypothetical protein E7A10_02120, partial [Dermabacter sp.]|nr:hypothetical protein [Dermabacter sp.]